MQELELDPFLDCCGECELYPDNSSCFCEFCADCDSCLEHDPCDCNEEDDA